MSARPSADADRFRRAHQERARLTTPDGVVEVDLTESPLRWLATRKDASGRPYLDVHEVEAGERFRRDFTLAGLAPRLSPQWGAPSGGGRVQGLDYSDLVVAARQRLARAEAAIGPDFSGVLVDVCGFLKGVEEMERARGWPVRAGKLVLKLALAALARHYGLSSVAVGPAKSSGLRAWSVTPGS